MAALSKDLIDRISDGLVDGEEPLVLSKEVGLPLEEVLAVAHNLYGKTFRAFTARQSAYLRDCMKYGIPHEAMGRILGVEVINLVQREPLTPQPSSNGHSQRKSKLEIGNKDLDWFEALRGIGEDDLHESEVREGRADQKIAYLISQFGRIAGLYASFRSGHPSVAGTNERIMEGVHLANSLAQDIAAYKSIFNTQAHPILTFLKESLAEMGDRAEDYLIEARKCLK